VAAVLEDLPADPKAEVGRQMRAGGRARRERPSKQDKTGKTGKQGKAGKQGKQGKQGKESKRAAGLDRQQG
jgi:hypothetical protein